MFAWLVARALPLLVTTLMPETASAAVDAWLSLVSLALSLKQAHALPQGHVLYSAFGALGPLVPGSNHAADSQLFAPRSTFNSVFLDGPGDGLSPRKRSPRGLAPVDAGDDVKRMGASQSHSLSGSTSGSLVSTQSTHSSSFSADGFPPDGLAPSAADEARQIGAFVHDAAPAPAGYLPFTSADSVFTLDIAIASDFAAGSPEHPLFMACTHLPTPFKHAKPEPKAGLAVIEEESESAALLPGFSKDPRAENVERVILPRLKASGLLSHPSAATAPQLPDDYPADRAVDDLMCVLRYHTANPVTRRNHARDITTALKGLVALLSRGDGSLGAGPGSLAAQLAGRLHLADVLYHLADRLYKQHAVLPEAAGFGFSTSADDENTAEVEEAARLLVRGIELHDEVTALCLADDEGQVEAWLDGVETCAGPGASGGWRVGDPKDVVLALASRIGYTVPRAALLVRLAFTHAALGRRADAIAAFEQVAALGLPSVGVVAANVAEAHRRAVDTAQLALLQYYQNRSDLRKLMALQEQRKALRAEVAMNSAAGQWCPADLLRPATKCTPQLDGDKLPTTSHADHIQQLLAEARAVTQRHEAVGLAARAVEHAAATQAPGSAPSPLLVEPLLEHSFHVISSPSLCSTTTFAQAISLLLMAVTLLQKATHSSIPNTSTPVGLPLTETLKLRARASSILAMALHLCNRVTDPLTLHRRSLALKLRAGGDARALDTVEPRVHIAALAAAQLWMTSSEGSEELSRVADKTFAQGSWKVAYGRGRPGRAGSFHGPVVPRCQLRERELVATWLHQHFNVGLHIVLAHLIYISRSVTELLRAAVSMPPIVESPGPQSNSPLSSNCPSNNVSTVLLAGPGSSTDHSSTRFNIGTVSESVSLHDSDGLKIATATTTEELDMGSVWEGSRGGMFRAGAPCGCVPYDRERLAAATAELPARPGAAELGLMVSELEQSCAEACELAAAAELHGVAVPPPAWIAHLCLPHWLTVLTLVEDLGLCSAAAPPDGVERSAVSALRRACELFTDTFTPPPPPAPEAPQSRVPPKAVAAVASSALSPLEAAAAADSGEDYACGVWRQMLQLVECGGDDGAGAGLLGVTRMPAASAVVPEAVGGELPVSRDARDLGSLQGGPGMGLLGAGAGQEQPLLVQSAPGSSSPGEASGGVSGCGSGGLGGGEAVKEDAFSEMPSAFDCGSPGADPGADEAGGCGAEAESVFGAVDAGWQAVLNGTAAAQDCGGEGADADTAFSFAARPVEEPRVVREVVRGVLPAAERLQGLQARAGGFLAAAPCLETLGLDQPGLLGSSASPAPVAALWHWCRVGRRVRGEAALPLSPAAAQAEEGMTPPVAVAVPSETPLDDADGGAAHAQLEHTRFGGFMGPPTGACGTVSGGSPKANEAEEDSGMCRLGVHRGQADVEEMADPAWLSQGRARALPGFLGSVEKTSDGGMEKFPPFRAASSASGAARDSDGSAKLVSTKQRSGSMSLDALGL